MTPPINPLLRQLQLARFERAIETATSIAAKGALLTTAEMARLNIIISGDPQTTGHTQVIDPWRTQSKEIQIPNGTKMTLALHKDPVMNLRDLLHRCEELAVNGNPLDAAIHLYSNMVIEHFFEDANRRTAAVGAHYFFVRFQIPLSGLTLHEIGLGDIRKQEHQQLLKDTLQQMVRFSERRKL